MIPEEPVEGEPSGSYYVLPDDERHADNRRRVPLTDRRPQRPPRVADATGTPINPTRRTSR